MLNPLIAATATELTERLQAREISAVEVVTAHLDRIDEVDGIVNAIPDVVAAPPGIRTTLDLPLPTGRGTYVGPRT